MKKPKLIMMNAQQLAAQLNGRQMGDEITEAEAEIAEKSDLVVVFGYSDDNIEFRGAIYNEVGCYGGGTIFVTKKGVLQPHSDCDCEYCSYKELRKSAKEIKAIWSKGDYSWQYETMIPHVPFDILEGKEKFCRGIVFHTLNL